MMERYELNWVGKAAAKGEGVHKPFGDSLPAFAGSGTTTQAVMELNLEDGGNRQYICVQMPEVLGESSEAYKAGYRTIADITRARIDKVIAKLKTEQPDKTTALEYSYLIM